VEPRISLITLGVEDLVRARAFYEALGFSASAASQGDIVFFRAGALGLALYPRAALAQDAMVSEGGCGFRGMTLAHNVRERAEVAAVLAGAEAAGARIVKPAQDVFWGGHSGYFCRSGRPPLGGGVEPVLGDGGGWRDPIALIRAGAGAPRRAALPLRRIEFISAAMNGESITYRAASVDDAAALAAFAAASFIATFGHLYPPDDLEAYLEKSYAPAVIGCELAESGVSAAVALRGDEIIGYAMWGPVALEAPQQARGRELYRLYVDASVKGRGVAHMLMQMVLDDVCADGAEALWLSVWEDNARAQAFYRRYGFEHVGEHKFMVGRIADRDFIWRRALDASSSRIAAK